MTHARFINRVGLRTKMSILSGTLLTMTATVAIVGAMALQTARQTTRELIDRAIPLRNGVLEIGRMVSDSHSTTVALLMMSPRSESASELRLARETAMKDAKQLVESMSRQFQGEDAPSFDSLRTRIEAMDAEQREIVEILAEDTADARRDAVDHARGAGEAAFVAAKTEIDDFLSDSESRVAAASVRMEENSASSKRALLGATLFAIACGVWIGMVIVRSVRKPLVDTTNVLKDMLAGNADFTRRVPQVRSDEFGDLSRAFNEFLEKQRQIFREVMRQARGVQQASTSLSAISEKIEAAAKRTSERTSEVSNGTGVIRERLATTSAGVKKLADDMNEVRAEVDAAAERSEKAVTSAESAGETMTRLAKASQEIGTVVKVISSIAEQTNLLALNATIEAARAGELGKGFAVVATEVKELAKGSSGATVDIERRVAAIRGESSEAKDSIDSIRTSIEALNRSVSAFATVARSQSDECKSVAGSVEEIASSASEISNSVRDLESIANDGATCAVDARSAASELTRIANGLGTLVGSFRVD